MGGGSVVDDDDDDDDDGLWMGGNCTIKVDPGFIPAGTVAVT
jgi:hypothetical protein